MNGMSSKYLKCICNVFLSSSIIKLEATHKKYLFWDIKPKKAWMLLFDLVDIKVMQIQFIEVKKET